MEDALYYNDLGDNLDPSLFEFTAGSAYADNVNLDAGKSIAYTASNWFFGSVAYEYIGRIDITLIPGEGVSAPVNVIPTSYGGWIMGGAGVWASSTPAATVPVSTGGWAMGGAGVWVSSTPTDTDMSLLADAEPTGYYLGGGAAAGEAEVISTIPGVDEIVTDGGFIFCGPGATGDAVTTFPAQDVIEAVAGFALGGAGVWSQVAPGDIPSAVLVGSGGFVLSGFGFSLDPGVTPTATEIVSIGGFLLGGIRPDSVEVTYPGSLDRVIEETVAFEMGGEGVWGSTTPATTIIISQGVIFILCGAGGLATVKSPPLVVITGDGGFALSGSGFAVGANDEVFETWVLNGQAFEPSVFSGFNFNSFAVHREQAYAAGDAGIYLLGGDHDAGEQIQTGARIGPVNFGADRDKRIRGIQYGQGGKNTRVRVESDEGDVGVFEPERDENRVVVSRDIQGREFTIDIMDFDELSHCEIFPLRLARR